MNKRAKEDIVAIVIVLVVGVPLLIGLLSFLSNLSCSDEKTQISTLISEKDICNKEILALNDTINNCTNLIRQERNICDSRINESVGECEETKETALNLIILYKISFVIYHILVLAIWLPLTFNLFKIIFKIGFRKEWEDKIFALERTWLILKIIFWAIVSIAIIYYLLLFFSASP